METPNTTDIDTIDLSKVFSQLIQLIIANVGMIIIIVIACLAGGALFYWLAPKKYESKMIIQSEVLSESYSFKLAENLNQHINDRDIEYLTSKLNLTPAEAHQLLGFEIVSALSPTSQLMDEKDKIIIVIVVRVSDNSVLPKLQQGIIDYLSTNDYVKRRVEETKKYYENIIASYDRELKMMDTLKIKISKGKYTSGKEGGALVMDLGGLFEAAGELYEKKYEAQKLLAVAESIQIIDPLTLYGKPVWPRRSSVFIASLTLAGAIAALVLIIRSRKPKITTTAS